MTSSAKKETQQSAPSSPAPVAGDSARIHYLVGGFTLSLVLLVLYTVLFEKEAPPFLVDSEIREPQRLPVGGDRPVIVIEDIDFGEEPEPEENPEPVSVREAEPVPPEQVADETAASAAGIDVANGSDQPVPPVAPSEQQSPGTAQQQPRQQETEPPASALVPPPGDLKGDYVIQIIATSSPDTASNIVEEIRNAGMRPYVERIDREGQSLHRVRVGPFPGRGEAEVAKRDLGALGYEDAIIIDLR